MQDLRTEASRSENIIPLSLNGFLIKIIRTILPNRLASIKAQGI